MENPILISHLNDFIFCPISIYFHQIYGDINQVSFQSTKQIEGTNVHNTVDCRRYSSDKSILQGVDVYSEKYNLIGKIDVFDLKRGELRERKKHITKIYDGYIFQVYAQVLALREMGYTVNKAFIYDFDKNKNYQINLPENDKIMFNKFKKLLIDIENFKINDFKPIIKEKCCQCIYEDLCDRSLLVEE